MGIGLSILLLAVGAVLVWAVNVDVDGVDLTIVGVIVMIVGAVGLLASLLALGSRNERDVVVDRRFE